MGFQKKKIVSSRFLKMFGLIVWLIVDGVCSVLTIGRSRSGLVES